MPRATLVMVVVCLVAFGCGQGRSEERRPRPARPRVEGVLATVNDVAITEAEVRLRSKRSSHEAGTMGEEPQAPEADPAAQAAVLETLIRDELMAQKAVALGLELDPEAREAIAAREADLAVFRRQKLAELYTRHDRARVEVTDAEARRFWDENSARLRRELHVWQILLRDEARIEEAHRRIQGGAAFEEVALAQYPNLPAEAPRPWDLGFLKWSQVPEAWRPALETLEKGQTTGVLRGPRNRFWIVKLVDTREDTTATFETWRANIMEILRAEKLERARADADRALREGARIEYTKRSGR